MEGVLIAAVVIGIVYLVTRPKKGRCRNCGQKVDARAHVCPFCGAAFS